MFFFKTSIVIEAKGVWFATAGEEHMNLKSSLHLLQPEESYSGTFAQAYSAVTNTSPIEDRKSVV